MGFSSLMKKMFSGGSQKAGPDPFSSLVIQKVEAGAVFELTNVGPEFEDFTLKVLAKHIYKQGNFSWFELECDKGGEKVWLDVEEDDELEVAIGLKRIGLEELGLDIESFPEQLKNKKINLLYEGKTYTLDEKGECIFCRHGDLAQSEPLTFWDFTCTDEQSFIGIEQWSDGTVDVTWSVPVKPSQIQVYSLKE